MRRIFVPLIFGVAGVAILISLGVWQLRRLDWKQAMLAEISAQIGGAPQALPPPGAGEALKYTPVQVSGTTTGKELLVLTGMKDVGPGYEVISAFETAEGRRVLIDRGFVPETLRRSPRPAVALTITGNLHWPAEADSYTPAPDLVAGVWFARDLPAMAAHLGTEPFLVVASRIDGEAQGITPVPIGIEGIRNEHFNYAMTWFLLALVWSGMTVFLVWRIRHKQF